MQRNCSRREGDEAGARPASRIAGGNCSIWGRAGRRDSHDRTSGWMSFVFVDISDQDVYEAMAEIPGFLDITTDDFKTLYRHAYQHAVDRLSCAVKVRAAMDAGALRGGRRHPSGGGGGRMTRPAPPSCRWSTRPAGWWA